MSYNTKNYTEQGGEKTVIGGSLEFVEGAVLKGGIVPNQADSSASTVADLKAAHNALLTKLKDAGLMNPDAWPAVSIAKQPAASGEISKETYEANMAAVDSVTIADGKITVTVDVDALTAYEGATGYGNHKWIGFLVTTGFDSIVGMKLNGSALTETDAQEATDHSGSAGDLSLYFAADTINGKTVTLWHTGYGEQSWSVEIIKPE